MPNNKLFKTYTDLQSFKSIQQEKLHLLEKDYSRKPTNYKSGKIEALKSQLEDIDAYLSDMSEILTYLASNSSSVLVRSFDEFEQKMNRVSEDHQEVLYEGRYACVGLIDLSDIHPFLRAYVLYLEKEGKIKRFKDYLTQFV